MLPERPCTHHFRHGQHSDYLRSNCTHETLRRLRILNFKGDGRHQEQAYVTGSKHASTRARVPANQFAHAGSLFASLQFTRNASRQQHPHRHDSAQRVVCEQEKSSSQYTIVSIENTHFNKDRYFRINYIHKLVPTPWTLQHHGRGAPSQRHSGLPHSLLLANHTS